MAMAPATRRATPAAARWLDMARLVWVTPRGRPGRRAGKHAPASEGAQRGALRTRSSRPGDVTPAKPSCTTDASSDRCFPAPVPVGSRIRAGGEIAEVTDVPGGVQAKLVITFEVEGGEKPACVAEVLVRYYG